jgi:hypothetical protein
MDLTPMTIVLRDADAVVSLRRHDVEALATA